MGKSTPNWRTFLAISGNSGVQKQVAPKAGPYSERTEFFHFLVFLLYVGFVLLGDFSGNLSII